MEIRREDGPCPGGWALPTYCTYSTLVQYLSLREREFIGGPACAAFFTLMHCHGLSNCSIIRVDAWFEHEWLRSKKVLQLPDRRYVSVDLSRSSDRSRRTSCADTGKPRQNACTVQQLLHSAERESTFELPALSISNQSIFHFHFRSRSLRSTLQPTLHLPRAHVSVRES